MTKPILIAEDNSDDVLMLEIALKKAGIANPIHAVGDGEETMAYFAGRGAYANRNQFPLPGALFLDLRLPRRNGFEVLQWLRSRVEFNDLLIVILTGARETRYVQHAYQLGANSFIVKPCHSSHLYTLILYFGKYWAMSDAKSEASDVEAGEGFVLEPALAFGEMEENASGMDEFARLDDDLACAASAIS
jgi:CheY-like chemotaxis protein